MSRTFSDIIVAQFAGQPYFIPVAYCGIDLKIVPIDILWSAYGVGASRTAVGVRVNMKAGGVQTPIAQIAGVVIDNTSNPVPVYVVFDSGMVVTCAPNSQVFSPAMASDLSCTIYGDGFTAANASSRTRVLLCDKPLAPFTNIEVQTTFPLLIASPSIQRDGSSILQQNYGSPALMDQSVAVVRDMTNGGTPSAPTQVLAQQSGGYYYIGGIFAQVTSLNVGVDRTIQLFLETISSPTDTLFNYVFSVDSTGNFDLNITLLAISGLNLKIDATKGLQLRQVSGAPMNSGFLTQNLFYTFNPNL